MLFSWLFHGDIFTGFSRGLVFLVHEIAVKGTKSIGHDFFQRYFHVIFMLQPATLIMYHENAINNISTAFSWCLNLSLLHVI